MKQIISLMLAFALAFSCTGAFAEFIFSTGGTSGTYYAFGNVLAQYISDNTDVKITAVTGSGSAANIDQLDMGFSQLALVQSDFAHYAYNGLRLDQYENAPIKSFSTLAALYNEAVQLVTCDPEIKSVADLKGKPVSIGAVGSGVYYNAQDFLAAYDMTVTDIMPQYLSFIDSVEAMKDGKITAAFITSAAPTASVNEICLVSGARLIGVDAQHLAKLKEINPFYAECVIPADTYEGMDADITTVAVMATLIANDQVSEDEAYTIVSTIFENKDEIADLHTKGAELDLDYASAGSVPYHAGARKYFDEKALEKLPEITGEIVFCPANLKEIKSLAFANCETMRQIYIPKDITSIAEDAFLDCRKDLLILGSKGSEAEVFAQKAGFTFVPYTPDSK